MITQNAGVAGTRTLVAAPIFALAALAALAGGCDGVSDDGFPTSALCCTEGDFQVGGTITGDYDGGLLVSLQAVADVSGIAAATIDDLTTACRSMAAGLDAPLADRDAAEAKGDKRERMQAYCTLAASAIGSFRAQAGGALELQLEGPKCSANVSAKATCQGSCSGSAKCDLKANPPRCEGGSLEISCKGGCTAEAGASVKCQGQCEGGCEGSCTAEGGVACSGKCDGMCKGTAEGGTGDGIQADGTCSGTCEGTCEVTAPGATCEGSCNGSCTASCKAEAGASVTCDGTCDGEFEPLKCEGGKLEGGCEVDAKCEASCDASVEAKAECTPPRVSVGFSGSADAQAAGKLKAVLEANLGLVATLEARLTGLGEATIALSANVDADSLVDIKLACIPVVIAAVFTAADDVVVSTEATATIFAELG